MLTSIKWSSFLLPCRGVPALCHHYVLCTTTGLFRKGEGKTSEGHQLSQVEVKNLCAKLVDSGKQPIKWTTYRKEDQTASMTFHWIVIVFCVLVSMALVVLIQQKQQIDACQAEKKTKADELASIEQKHAELAAKLKSESGAWEQEIQSLKARISGYRPICDHVKNIIMAVKLCGTKDKPVDKGEKASQISITPVIHN
ncbi:hypothetical protein PBY51_005032 [Eleginops maclovinus]|uniref:Uncharacterized protein n=1 Tax=Eleginops maclovinus TaxID=56733 RepID=A0AAN8AG95_ELEMC|nr:hypothetical protein PBY51_005032 [Eleginops maclovinus]